MPTFERRNWGKNFYFYIILLIIIHFSFQSLKIGNVLKDQGLYEKFMKEPQLSNPAKLEKPTMQTHLGPSPTPHAPSSAASAAQGMQQSSGAGLITPMGDDQSKIFIFIFFDFVNLKVLFRYGKTAERSYAHAANGTIQLPRYLRDQFCWIGAAYYCECIGKVFLIFMLGNNMTEMGFLASAISIESAIEAFGSAGN